VYFYSFIEINSYQIYVFFAKRLLNLGYPKFKHRTSIISNHFISKMN
jgi:hypothetical protein